MAIQVTQSRLLLSTSTANNMNHLVFIDSQVADYQSLAAGVVPGAEVVILDRHRNGIEQISAVLRQRSHTSTVHIVSHGSPGCLSLGNTQLSLNTLNSYASDLKSWFSPTPYTLLLYGCNVAAGDAGEEFIAKLHDITGADIAASKTRTGNVAKGGNWELEYQTGKLAPEIAFTEQTQHAYAAVLIDISIDNDTSGAIDDSTTTDNPLVRTFTVTENITVDNISLGFNATHPYRGDIEAILESPNGTRVTLIDSADDSLDNYDFLLQSGGATEINDDDNDNTAAPIYGADRTASPSNAFTPFIGESALGTWRLEIADTFSDLDDGTFNSAQLNITGNATTTLPSSRVYYGDVDGGIFSVNLDTGVDSLETTSTLVTGTINALAANPDNDGLAYYGSGTTIYIWDSINNTHQVLSDLSTFGDFTGGTLESGGGSYVNGIYYVGAEAPGGAGNINDIYAVQLSADGKTVTGLTPLNVPAAVVSAGLAADEAAARLFIGEFGDLVVTLDGASATVYGATVEAGFWSFDVATNTFSVINSTYPGQLAAEADGTLWAGNGTTLQQLDKTTGNVVSGTAFTLSASMADLTGPHNVSQQDPDPGEPPTLDLDGDVAGNDYQTTFTENNLGVAIADSDMVLTASGNLTGATIVLTNRQPGDVLTLGTLPGGITGAVDNTSDPNTITVTLSGSASTADYVAALSGIGATSFANATDDPDLTDRIFAVTVTDGANFSTANATVQVNPVNDPPTVDLNGNTPATSTVSDTSVTGATPTVTGTISNGGSSADYTLTRTAKTGGTTTVNYVAGSNGIETRNNLFNGQGDSFTYQFDVTPDAQTSVESVSLYRVGYTTGGNEEDSSLALTWTGGGAGIISDPDDQIANYADGDIITTGAVLELSFPDLNPVNNVTNSNENSESTWRVDIAADNLNVQVTDDPNAASQMVNEWLTFNATITQDVDYATTFTENDPAVSIADPASFTADVDDENLAFATITLTNPQTDDRIVIDSTPVANGDSGTVNGIAYTISTGGSGEIIVNLAGAATKAAYADAIELIQFENTADDPATTPDRIFTVTVNDGEANSNTATTTIEVIPLNDPPTVNLDPDNSGGGADDAGFEATFTEGNGALNVVDADADVSDAENNVTSLEIVVSNISDGANEIITLAGQTFALNTDQSFTGVSVGGSSVDLNYVAATGTFVVTNNADATTPIPQAALDTLLQGTTYENQSENPTPGDRTLTFTVTDAFGATSDPATSTITVDPAPDAAADSFSTDEDSALTINGADLLTNDDQGNAPASITNVDTTSANGGAITDNGDGTYSYTPATNFTGTDSFTYTITDADGDTSTATVNVTVNPVPDAVDDSFSINANATQIIRGTTLVSNDDQGDAPATITAFDSTSANGGTITDNGDGTYSYTPATNFTGTDSFTYTITDNNGDTSTATVNIIIDDAIPDVIIDDAITVEGTQLVYKVSLTEASTEDIVLDLFTPTNIGTATANTDYETTGFEYRTDTSGAWIAANNGTEVTIPAGDTSIEVRIDSLSDTIDEADETVPLRVSSVVSGTVGNFRDTGTGTIVDNDEASKIFIDDVAIVEGDSGTQNAVFTVSLSNPSAGTVTVNYTTADGTATAGADYTGISSPRTLFFAPGETSKTIAVAVRGDTASEENETFFVNLSSPSTNATLADNQGQGTIRDNDIAPDVSISNATATEGNDLVFDLSLSEASNNAIELDLSTVDGSATGGTDYETSNFEYSIDGGNTYISAANGNRVTIPAGSTSIKVRIDSFIDGETETTPETFTLGATPVTAGTVGDTSDTGEGTITADALPALFIDDVAIVEGDSGTQNAVFTVSLSNASSAGSVIVNYSTADGTATTADNDYTETSGTLTLDLLNSSQTIAVPVIGDTSLENNETFLVNLSTPSSIAIADGQGEGTIRNDDVAPDVTISDAIASEGDFLIFDLSLSEASDTAIELDLSTADGTATGGTDFATTGFEYSTDGGSTWTSGGGANGATVTIAAGSTSIKVRFNSTDDQSNPLAEADETFTLGVSSVVSGTVNDISDTGTATIVDDEGVPSLSISDITISEGDSGTQNATFTVTLANASSETITVDYATADGTATTGEDYTGTNGTLAFAPGETTQTITVAVSGDTTIEDDETFLVNLTNVSSNATIADPQATGTLENDDAGVSGFVFGDFDNNGIRGAFEEARSGIEVTLLRGGADGVIGTADDTTETVTTDDNGLYRFSNLSTGEQYQLAFGNLPTGASFSPANAGNDDRDSDVDGAGETPIFTLGAGESRNNVSAGIVAQDSRNFIEGTTSPDTLTGTAGDDLIAGYKGQDVLTGGDGSDTFFYNETSEGIDIITDFVTGTDQIDFTQVRTEVAAKGVYTDGDPVADYIKVTSFRSGTFVKVDFDGNGSLAGKNVIYLQGVDASTVDVTRDILF